MIDLNILDSQIDSLPQWITLAGKALMRFYNEDKGVFWRDSFGMKERDKDLHPTSTNRSYFALSEYLRFLYEEDSAQDSKEKVSNILRGVSEKYIAMIIRDSETPRMSTDNKLNMFTDSHLLLSCSRLQGLKQLIKLNVDTKAVKKAIGPIAATNKEKLLQCRGGKVNEKDEIHDFVTLQVVRALDVYSGTCSGIPTVTLQSLQDRVKEDVLRSLAFHYSGISSSFDPAELAFSIALLNRFPTTDAPQLTRRAFLCISKAQAKDGSWPTSRYISYEKLGLLHVASYEVALTLTDLLIRRLYDNDIEFGQEMIPTLDQAFGLVRSHYYWTGNSIGWANDHTRRTGLVESWATAVVLTFLIHYHDALMQLRQCLILRSLRATNQRESDDPPIAWPDIIPAFFGGYCIDVDRLDHISDPFDGAILTTNLKAKILNPIKDDWIHRPQKASLVLYGPPGTRKTTLVTQIAKALGWPIIMLSPPHFLRQSGLEGFEASAAEIFDNLFRLRRVVVLFDECEDFFKKRSGRQQLESRTIGAFITAGMLPRLQTLHDNRWVIFVLNTNIDLGELDEAVTRPGRFDYKQKVEYPTLEAQLRYIESRTNSEIATIMKNILASHQNASRSKGKQSVSTISFSLLDEFATKAKGLTTVTQRELSRVFKELINQKGPSSLV